jgi:DNA-binding beta-propeller fold protein YncE
VQLSRGGGLLIAIVALASPASATAAPIGSLTQLSGTAGCNAPAGNSEGCSTTTGITEANGVGVSPDGKSAYAVSDVDNSVLEFSRDPSTGALTQLASPNNCIAQGGLVCGTISGRGLSEATGVTVSPDGKNVYVASSSSAPGVERNQSGGFCGSPNCEGAVAVFKRNLATGALTQLSGSAGCVSETATLNGSFEATCASGTGLGDANSVVVSPLGDHVYVSSGDSNAIAEFSRNASTGALTQLSAPNACISEGGAGSGECGTTTAKGLGEAFSLAVSPDGATIYAAAQGLTTGVPQTDGGIAAFHRNPGTGVLTQLSGANACVQEGGADGCSTGRGLAGASSVAVSSDGKNVYAAATDSDALSVFARNTGTGGLTQLGGTAGCVQASGGGDGCATATGQRGDFAVRVAPDGASVYAGAPDDQAVSEFARNSGTGALTQLASPNDCISSGGGGCGTTSGRGLGGSGIHSLEVSPNGKNVYVTGGSSVATFARAVPAVVPAPSLSGLKLSPRKASGRGRLVKGRCVKQTRKNRHHKRCTRKIKLKITYTLNIAASVKLVLKRQTTGRKVKGRCVKKTRKNRKHKHCKLLKAAGTITHISTAGANSFTLRRKLKPGHYILTLTATAGGKSSAPKSISFSVTR